MTASPLDRAADALAPLSRGVSAAAPDRIALEDRACRMNQLLRRVDAGHEALIVTRGGQAKCVVLPDLSLDELHRLVDAPLSAMDLDEAMGVA